MSKDYEIVRYQDHFKQDVIELQKHLWSPHSELNASYLEWKYERNPYLKQPLIYLAQKDRKIVAMRGMLGAKWEVGNPATTFLGICSEDLVVDPGHRNRGLMKKIMETAFVDLANAGHQYVYSLSAGPVTLLASLATGWKKVGSFQPHRLRSKRYERFRRIRGAIGGMRFFWRFAGNLPGHNWAESRQPLPDLLDRRSRLRRMSDPNILVEATPRPEEMADLVLRINYDGRIRHVRDRKYFTWRFLNPLHSYLFLYWKKNRLEGYLVLQEHVSGLRSRIPVNIVDWEGTSRRVLSDLLHAAIDLHPFPELCLWTATMGEEMIGLLRETGFRPVPERARKEYEEPSLIVRPVRDDLMKTEWSLGDRRLLEMANWDLRMIYSMNG